MQWKSITKVGVVAVFSAVALMANAGGHQSLASISKANLYETAKTVGSLDTFVAAIDAADIAETLQNEGPFTLWAPTDEAFEALPAGMLEDLLKPENKAKLQAVLRYHVVAGRTNSLNVQVWAVNGVTVQTVEGSTIAAVSADGQITINDANVVQTDVQARNGVIHVIDAVLVPPDSYANGD